MNNLLVSGNDSSYIPTYGTILSKSLVEIYCFWGKYDVNHKICVHATIDRLLDLYHKVVPYSGLHERNWSGIFLEIIEEFFATSII